MIEKAIKPKTSINVQTSHTLNEKHHERIKTIKNTMVELNNPPFRLDFISREEMVKETEKLCNKTLLKILMSL